MIQHIKMYLVKSPTFTQSETDKITKELSNNPTSTFRKINSVLLKKFLNLQDSLTEYFI